MGPFACIIKGEIRLLVADEPVEFEILSVQFQDFRILADHFRRVYGMYLKVDNKKNRKITHHATGWTWKHEDFD
jgi:hypothetical protein